MAEYRWTDNHGPDELYDKFAVYKAGKEWSDVPGLDLFHTADRLGQDGEFIFVLRPETDREACEALKRYVHLVAHRAPKLAQTISAQLTRIRTKERQ